MTLEQLLSNLRFQLNDLEEPYLWSDDELCVYIKTAFDDICRLFNIIQNNNYTINILQNIYEYNLDSFVVKINTAYLVSTNSVLGVVPYNDFVDTDPNFLNNLQSGNIRRIIVDLQSRKLYLDSIPEENDTIRMSIQSLPQFDYTTQDFSKYQRVLEIPDHIIMDICANKIKQLAYLKDDTEIYNLEKSKFYLMEYNTNIEKLKRSFIRVNQIDRKLRFPSGIL